MSCFHHSIKSGKKGSAVAHSTYISRNEREDLIHTSHGNLPDWAKDDPKVFWRMASMYERANGAVYREHEIALPNELTIDQLIVLAERLVRQLVGIKPYQYAIHAPDGKLGGVANPHVHLMFSDRMPDGIDRPATQMFSRYNAKHPELGGCRKDSGGQAPLEHSSKVVATRKTSADIQNQMLAECGHDTRVDHRSLRAQGIQRRAERHLGPAFVRGMSAGEKATYAMHRAPGNLVG